MSEAGFSQSVEEEAIHFMPRFKEGTQRTFSPQIWDSYVTAEQKITVMRSS